METGERVTTRPEATGTALCGEVVHDQLSRSIQYGVTDPSIASGDSNNRALPLDDLPARER